MFPLSEDITPNMVTRTSGALKIATISKQTCTKSRVMVCIQIWQKSRLISWLARGWSWQPAVQIFTCIYGNYENIWYQIQEIMLRLTRYRGFSHNQPFLCSFQKVSVLLIHVQKVWLSKYSPINNNSFNELFDELFESMMDSYFLLRCRCLAWIHVCIPKHYLYFDVLGWHYKNNEE